jgi:Fe-S-cluster containining protein
MSGDNQPFDPDSADGLAYPEQENPGREAKARRGADTEMDIFDGIRGAGGGPVEPVRLRPEDLFCFSCHKDVPCWNACCRGADITLTPGDILRLSGHFGIAPPEFLKRYTVAAIWEQADLPVAKLRMGASLEEGGGDGKGDCPFLAGDEGCGVYAQRPVTCRYYPLGLASVKMKGDEEKNSFHFLVKEDHCKGHGLDKLQSVSQYRDEQGLKNYDKINQGWIDILMKMASWKTLGGPGGKEIAAQTKQMFFLVSTNPPGFRQFVLETKFLDTYSVDPEFVERIKTDDELLTCLGFDWLKNVMFNEPTIAMKEAVLQEAVAKARGDLGAS